MNSNNSSCVLYLGAIPYNWDVEVIKSVVCGSGPVVDVRCMMDNASKNKGFCFVEYSTPDSAFNALNILSKVKIEGRKKLRIELSKEGLRNPVPGQKPELPLNRNFLPSNVILPPEMLANYPSSSNSSTSLSGITQLKKLGSANPTTNEILSAISTNPQVQQMVSQMIANGMDMNQIGSVVQQFTRQQQSQQTSQSNPLVQSQQQPQLQQPSLVPPFGSNQIPQHLLMASQYLPLPQQSHQSLLAKDKVSETLSTIQPGILIELLAKLKMILSSPNPNYAEAAKILNDNPKLAVAAAQSLLLMGIIDLDVINQSMNGQLLGNQVDNNISNSNNSHLSSNTNPSSNINSNINQNLNSNSNSILNAVNISNNSNANSSTNNQFMYNQFNNSLSHQQSQNSQSQQQSIVQPKPIVMSGSSTPTGIISMRSNPSSTSTSPSPQQNKQINPEWLSLPQHTINKLLNISEQEANLIFQVLKLAPQQIETLPENEKLMATQIRAQYL